MKRLMGRVVVHQSKSVLKYYLSGSRKEGYSITILHQRENEKFISKCENFTRSIVCASRLCNKLVRGVVFPDQLQEIVADQI